MLIVEMRAPLLLVLGVLAAACTTFASAPEPDAGSGGPDGGLLDGAQPGTPDGGALGDAGPPCGLELVAGSREENTTVPNDVGGGSIDAYGFVVVADGAVRCLHARIGAFGGTAIAAGIYDDEDGTPRNRLAVARFEQVTENAWNVARLAPPIPLVAGTRIWLAITSTESIGFRSKAGGCPLDLRIAFTNAGGSVPSVFAQNPTRTDHCDGLLYLTR